MTQLVFVANLDVADIGIYLAYDYFGQEEYLDSVQSIEGTEMEAARDTLLTANVLKLVVGPEDVP